MVTPDEAPRLTDWVTATEMATVFGVSRQAVNQLIKGGEFETLHTIGPVTRPRYIVRRDEVDRMRETVALEGRGQGKRART